MPPKKQAVLPDPQFSTSESEGLAAVATVCRNALDEQDRDLLLDMLGLGSPSELRERLAASQGKPFNHYPSALL